MRGVGVTLGLGFGVGSASASPPLVSLHESADTPDVYAYYSSERVPESHLREYQDRGYDVRYAVDARNLDSDFSLSLNLQPSECNIRRQSEEWGSLDSTSTDERLLDLFGPVESIVLTDSGLEAQYRKGRSGAVVDVNKVDGWPIRELFYRVPTVPASHLDGFERQAMDVISATDIRDRDEEGLVRVAVTPEHRNTKRTRGVWGVEQGDGGLVRSEEATLVDVSADVASIELTDAAVKVNYES